MKKRKRKIMLFLQGVLKPVKNAKLTLLFTNIT